MERGSRCLRAAGDHGTLSPDPGAAGPGFEHPRKVKRAWGVGGSWARPRRAGWETGQRVWPARRARPPPRSLAAGSARVGDPGAPHAGPGALPPGPTAAPGRSDLLRLNLGGGRGCARGSSRDLAASGSGKGRVSWSRSRARGRIRRSVAPGATPHPPDPGRAGTQPSGGAPPVPPWSADPSPSRAAGVASVRSGRGSCPGSLSGPDSRPGIQRAGPTAGSAAPGPLGSRGHSEPAGARPRGRASGLS